MEKDTEYDPLGVVVITLALVVVEGLFIEVKHVPTFPTLSTATSSTS